ncbi:MAG: D-cysteine desulfhydrase family protein [Bacteroidetes bacterium]|nr:D-cysteine desulfhydrase family protein [Bacteroidota bacterium]
MQQKQLPKVNLGFFPTPLHQLKRLTEKLGGPNIYMKRDDLTGLALGGNKTRKLEFLIGHAIKQGCNTVITGGAAQSNHCRQTAAAAAMFGMECHLVLGGSEPSESDGNLLLDKLFGAKIHWSGDFRKGEKIPELFMELKSIDKKPYIIPYGGSNDIGALGFVNAMLELKVQSRNMGVHFSHVVFASSSGGTHAGLIVGNDLFDCNVTLIGIGIDKEELPAGSIEKQISLLTGTTSSFMCFEKNVYPDDIIVRTEYLGEGYGVIGDAERESIKLLAETEGILLDPVYTGRAMAGLIDMIRKGEFNSNDNVLFWHTGGSPSIFHYGNDLK